MKALEREVLKNGTVIKEDLDPRYPLVWIESKNEKIEVIIDKKNVTIQYSLDEGGVDKLVITRGEFQAQLNKINRVI